MKTLGKAANALQNAELNELNKSFHNGFHSVRDFKLVCNAANTMALYISKELLMPIIKSHSHLNHGLLEQMFKERAIIL